MVGLCKNEWWVWNVFIEYTLWWLAINYSIQLRYLQRIYRLWWQSYQRKSTEGLLGTSRVDKLSPGTCFSGMYNACSDPCRAGRCLIFVQPALGWLHVPQHSESVCLSQKNRPLGCTPVASEPLVAPPGCIRNMSWCQSTPISRSWTREPCTLVWRPELWLLQTACGCRNYSVEFWKCVPSQLVEHYT